MSNTIHLSQHISKVLSLQEFRGHMWLVISLLNNADVKRSLITEISHSSAKFGVIG